jgi:hypothetical protein
VLELVDEWVEQSPAAGCTSWPAAYGSDLGCVGGSGSNLPGALFRGGSLHDAPTAGVFYVAASEPLWDAWSNSWGFRCAR